MPKGFFPVQDTGIIQGISEAPESISFPAMAAAAAGSSAPVILKDPAVESLSSFIGVDGTNTTLNSGRILINLKPLEERKINASEVIRRLQPELEKVDGITLYMQPVQDLTVEDRVSRTQYQYTLEDPDLNELNDWTAKLVDKLKQIPELRDVATDQQTGGLAAALVIDRVTASRMGITPPTIDQTLYDAFGQRQVSTLYTQLNQYHVILETMPDFQKNPAKLQDIYVRSALASNSLTTGSTTPSTVVTASTASGDSNSSRQPRSRQVHCSFRLGESHSREQRRTAQPCRSARSRISNPEPRRSPSIIRDNFRSSPFRSIWRPNASLGEATKAIDKVAEGHRNAAQRSGGVSGHRRVVPGFADATSRF